MFCVRLLACFLFHFPPCSCISISLLFCRYLNLRPQGHVSQCTRTGLLPIFFFYPVVLAYQSPTYFSVSEPQTPRACQPGGSPCAVTPPHCAGRYCQAAASPLALIPRALPPPSPRPPPPPTFHPSYPARLLKGACPMQRSRLKGSVIWRIVCVKRVMWACSWKAKQRGICQLKEILCFACFPVACKVHFREGSG